VVEDRGAALGQAQEEEGVVAATAVEQVVAGTAVEPVVALPPSR
jgi:hypothetical protein